MTIDYRIFIPFSQSGNFIEILDYKIPIDTIYSVDLKLTSDEVLYWIYILIYSRTEIGVKCKKKAKGLEGKLFLGNSKYFAEGTIEIFDLLWQKKDDTYRVKLFFNVKNASKTLNNIRTDNLKVNRLKLMDI